MFTDFFFHMRRRGLKVGLTEWMSVMEGLKLGLAQESLAGFYHLTRSLCVKSEGLFDLFDQCFVEHFKGAEAPAQLKDDLLAWLEDPKALRALSQEEMERIEALDLDELKRLFEERLAEQKERHDGGNRWIGTGGTSPFGHAGYHPGGMRVGGQSSGRSAVQVAAERRYQNLRHDLVLDTRQIGLALKRLRVLAREGVREELDLEASIDATARNAGDIDLVFRAERKNSVKLLLLMDVGGSMTGHAQLCEQLFSAAHAVNHFKEFRHYYFHNCPYDFLYTDAARLETIPTMEALRQLDDSWFLLVVGDAAMSPYELTAPGGCIDYFHHNDEPGLVWLQKLRETLPRSVWLNPEPEAYWSITSTQLVRRVFTDMHPLTLGGLDAAVRRLRRFAQA